MPNILNVSVIFFLILFTYSIAGMNLFGMITEGPLGFINTQSNFTTFYNSIVTLFRCSTGENWPGIMYDLNSIGIVDYIYWVLFISTAYFVTLNIFIAIICDEF